jgi:hypothetical protein
MAIFMMMKSACTTVSTRSRNCKVKKEQGEEQTNERKEQSVWGEAKNTERMLVAGQ